MSDTEIYSRLRFLRLAYKVKKTDMDKRWIRVTQYSTTLIDHPNVSALERLNLCVDIIEKRLSQELAKKGMRVNMTYEEFMKTLETKNPCDDCVREKCCVCKKYPYFGQVTINRASIGEW